MSQIHNPHSSEEFEERGRSGLLRAKDVSDNRLAFLFSLSPG